MSEHHIVISADSHCGADLWDYRNYLESKYHPEFDDWARSIEAAQARTAERFKDAPRADPYASEPMFEISRLGHGGVARGD